MRSGAVATILFVGFVASACGSEHVDFFQSLSQDPAFPGQPGDSASYDNLFAYAPDPSCTPSVPRMLDRRTEVRIFRGNGVTTDTVARFVGGLKRYYDHYGVTMFTRHEVLSVALDHAIVLNESAITDWMRKNTDVDPSSKPSPGTAAYTRFEQALGGAMFFNVKQFLRTYAEPQQDVINIVLLKRVASLDPSADVEALNWGVAGLGFSQELINSTAGSDLGGSLADELNETDYSPTVFIAVNLTDFVLPEPDIVIAHEFGHAYGLEHTTSTGNLMTQGLTECSVSLDSSQLTTIEQAAARYGNVLDASRYSALDFLSYVHRADEISNIMRTRLAQHALPIGETP